MREAAKKVGLFHQLPESVGRLVVGRQVAVSSFVEALAKYGTRYQYDLFSPGLQRAPIQTGLDAITTPSASRPSVDVHDQRDLLQQSRTRDFAAWHDTQFDTYRPFALRSRMAQSFPISIVHHTLSYPDLLHDTFLRLLLNRTYPYDTIVCTSSAAKEVSAHLLEHVSSSFNEQYGTRLAYHGRLEVIPLGVDTERFKPRDKKALRSQFDLPQHAFVLLWIGRLSAIDKADLIQLVHMFADLVRENPDRDLKLVCAGSEHPAERFGAFLQGYAGSLN
ncbi:MAG TPA: hypothetical protein VKP65_11915, partial [Rhodothermales bacterium]|nr:hypothetical protein [Rhodothermales bacterium]